MSILATIEQDARDVKAFLLKVIGDAPKVVQTVAQDTAAIAPVVEAFVPGSVAVVSIVQALLALAEKAVTDAADAIGANGVSVILDTALVNDIKSVITTAKKA